MKTSDPMAKIYVRMLWYHWWFASHLCNDAVSNSHHVAWNHCV